VRELSARHDDLYLKAFHNVLLSNRPVQNLIRSAARAGALSPNIYAKLPPLGPHPVSSPAGREFVYWADEKDMMARGVVWENLRVWEASSLKAFSELVKDAERFVDVGAYTGIYSLVACADGDADVIAVEPNPAIRPLLERNIRANGWQERITVIPMAASNAPGVAHMTIPSDTTAAHLNEMGTGPAIRLTTIDELLDGRKVDIMKVDVEGFEPRVLEGARNTLARYQPSLIVESLSAEAFEDIRSILGPLGYSSCQHLHPDGPVMTSSYVHMPRYASFLWTTEATGSKNRYV